MPPRMRGTNHGWNGAKAMVRGRPPCGPWIITSGPAALATARCATTKNTALRLDNRPAQRVIEPRLPTLPTIPEVLHNVCVESYIHGHLGRGLLNCRVRGATTQRVPGPPRLRDVQESDSPSALNHQGLRRFVAESRPLPRPSVRCGLP